MPRVVRCSLIQASNVGAPDGSLENVSWLSDSGSPTTPGMRRATASMRTMAGISPPLST